MNDLTLSHSKIFMIAIYAYSWNMTENQQNQQMALSVDLQLWLR